MNATSTLSLTSQSFEDGGMIPSRFTCDGEGISPYLSISGVPSGAQSLVLIVEDPDVPVQLKPDGLFVHWVLFNIPPTTAAIPENGSAGISGANTTGKSGYVSPCPPTEYQPSEHRYFFYLYALDTTLDLAPGASKDAVASAMNGHVIAQAQLMGRYQRAK